MDAVGWAMTGGVVMGFAIHADAGWPSWILFALGYGFVLRGHAKLYPDGLSSG